MFAQMFRRLILALCLLTAMAAAQETFCPTSQNITTCINNVVGVSTVKELDRNDRTLLFVNVSWYDPLANKSYIRIAQFFPKVNTYSRLVIENVSSILTLNPEESQLSVQAFFVSKSGRNRISIFESPPATWCKRLSGVRCVKYRSIVATLRNGNFSSVDWEPTAFPFYAQQYLLDGMMTVDCATSFEQCDRMHIYVMWQGTDKTGFLLDTSSMSIAKLTWLP